MNKTLYKYLFTDHIKIVWVACLHQDWKDERTEVDEESNRQMGRHQSWTDE